MNLHHAKSAFVALAVITMVVAAFPTGALATSSHVAGAWTTDGTRWDAAATVVTPSEVDRFASIWTERFLQASALEAYLNRPGLYDDGFNELPDSDKVYLTVHLLRHWERTFPAFGKDVWTGEAAHDQKQFEELASLVYATIFAKDEFFGALRESFPTESTIAPPSLDAEAGHEQFPGLSQAEIDAHFESIHAAARAVAPDPLGDSFAFPDPLLPETLVSIEAPEAPAPQVLEDLAIALDAPRPDIAEPTRVVLEPLQRARIAPPETPDVPYTPDVSTPVDLVLAQVEDLVQNLRNVEPQELAPSLLNLVEAGTYLACGQLVDGDLTCAPAAVPLGTPVMLDLDGDLLTGVAGAEVLTHLSPAVDPEFTPGGLAASLEVRRTMPSTVLGAQPLPALVFVVYRVAPAGLQIVAGFDGRDDTLADVQEARATIKDLALALAGDVRLRAVMTREGPTSALALVAGHARVDPTSFPPTVTDPTIASIHFQPAPLSLQVDLRFANEDGQDILEGQVASTAVTTVTATVTMAQGDTYRRMAAVIEDLPTSLDFRVVSQAVGAVHLAYTANAPFTRFALDDLLIPDVNDVSVHSTLQAEVLDIPAGITFDITRPFNVAYSATSRVGEVSVLLRQVDADGLAQSIYGHVEGVPATWAISGTETPLSVHYEADGAVDVLDFSMYEREEDLQMAAHVEGIPRAIDVLVEDGHVAFAAEEPIALVEASFAKGGLPAPSFAGEFASYVADGSGAMAAATRIAGLTSFELDTRTTDVTHVNVKIAGGEPFFVHADDPSVFAQALLSNLPTEIDVLLTPSAFTYDFAEAVTQIDVYAEIADLVAHAQVLDLPDEATVSWSNTGLTWDANSAITRIFVDLEKDTLRLQATVLNIPADFTAGWGNGVATFNTPTAIGRVNVLASLNGGSVSSYPGDHLVVQQTASAMGVSFQLTGIRSATADPRNGGSYALGLSPGGQTFDVYADLVSIDVYAHVSNLPQNVLVDLAPAASRFGYTSDRPITLVWAYATSTNGRTAYVQLEDLPARVDVTWTLGATPVVTYDASSSLGRIYAQVQETTGAVYYADIQSVPAWMRLSIGANDISFDARTSATSAPGSGTVGSILARYGSDGNVLGGSGNHANVYQRGTLTRASLGYNGLQYARVSQVNDNLLVDVMNSAPRYFTAYADTDEAYLSLIVNSIPAHVRVTSAGTTFTYNAYGATINQISGTYTDREGLTAIASIQGIPGSATLSLNMPGQSISYSASSAITSIDVDVWKDSWYGLLRLTSIPTAWSANFGGGIYRFDAPTALGSVRVAVTNHGTYSMLGGNHVNLNYAQGTSGGPLPAFGETGIMSTPDVIDASFLMTQVKRADYRRVGTSNTLDLQMGGGTPFTARGNLAFASGDLAYLYTTFTPLPASIQASLGESMSITNSANFDIYAYAHYGKQAALDATPTPPTTHGATVRDGASGANRAVKAILYLTGLPTGVSVDSRNAAFGFTNWRPAYNYLVVDAELDNLVSPAVDAYAYLNGLSTSAPTSLTYNMDVVAGTTKTTRVDFTTTRALGRLYADANIGNNHGRIDVSNIPDDIHATYNVANGVTSFSWDATSAISSIYAGFRIPTQSASFQGYISFTDVPSDFAITLGRAGGGQGPTVTYDASASTLDLSAYVDASLFAGDLKARLSFGFTNLGSNVDVYLSGTGLRFTSSPATGSLYANVWGSYNYYRSASGIWDEGGFLEFPWAYHIGVNPNVNNLGVTLSGFSDFNLQWGVTSKLSGSYSAFSLGWDSMSVYLDLYGKVQIVVDWPWPFGESVITLVDYHTHQTVPVNVLFHKYTNHQSNWFGVSGWAICDWSLSTTIRPHPHGSSWNGVSVTGATAEGGAWYVVPNPYGWVPSWAVDLAARYTSPDGGSGPGLNFDYDCI